MNRQTRPPRRGFTLVELLVVLAIIGILAAIITPAVFRSMVRAREARIFMEINQLHMAVESYRQRFGDYPPDFSNPDVVRQHLRRAFPRHSDTVYLDILLEDDNRPTPAEALVFWLSQLRNNPRNPLSGPGETIAFFDFDESEMRRRPSRQLASLDPALQLYDYRPLDTPTAPYVYFQSRTYVDAGYLHSDVAQVLRPYWSQPVGSSRLDWANPGTFQIISAGLDAEFGEWRNPVDPTDILHPPPALTYKLFPRDENRANVPVNDITVHFLRYGTGDYDNITNFSDGRTFGDHLE